MTLTIDLPDAEHHAANLLVGEGTVHFVDGYLSVGLRKVPDDTHRMLYAVQYRNKAGERFDSEPMQYADALAAPGRVPDPKWAAFLEQKCETCEGEGKLYCDGCGGHLCPNPTCGDPACPNPHWCPDDCDGTTPDCSDCLGSGLPLVPVTVPCKTQHTTHGCRAGCTDGRLSLYSVTIDAQLVPVTDDEREMMQAIKCKRSALVVAPNANWLLIIDGQVRGNGQDMDLKAVNKYMTWVTRRA